MTEPPNKPLGGYFPLGVIRTLIFGDDAYIDVKPQSKAPNDFSKVIIQHIGIGLYLKSLDPEEAYFHIEVYPEASTSEIWLAFEWIESSARHERLRSSMAKEREARDRHNARVREMISAMPEALPDANKQHLAETILKEMSYNRFDKVLELLNVAHLYLKYEQEDKVNEIQQNQKETSAANANVIPDGASNPVESSPQGEGEACPNEETGEENSPGSE